MEWICQNLGRRSICATHGEAFICLREGVENSVLWPSTMVAALREHTELSRTPLEPPKFWRPCLPSTEWEKSWASSRPPTSRADRLPLLTSCALGKKKKPRKRRASAPSSRKFSARQPKPQNRSSPRRSRSPRKPRKQESERRPD